MCILPFHSFRTNLPKEIMTFIDFPTLDSPRSYIYSDEFLAYLQSYAEHYDVIKCIRYRHQVINIRPSDEGKGIKWEVCFEMNLDKSNECYKNISIFIWR